MKSCRICWPLGEKKLIQFTHSSTMAIFVGFDKFIMRGHYLHLENQKKVFSFHF